MQWNLKEKNVLVLLAHRLMTRRMSHWDLTLSY